MSFLHEYNKDIPANWHVISAWCEYFDFEQYSSELPNKVIWEFWPLINLEHCISLNSSHVKSRNYIINIVPVPITGNGRYAHTPDLCFSLEGLVQMVDEQLARRTISPSSLWLLVNCGFWPAAPTPLSWKGQSDLCSAACWYSAVSELQNTSVQAKTHSHHNILRF